MEEKFKNIEQLLKCKFLQNLKFKENHLIELEKIIKLYNKKFIYNQSILIKNFIVYDVEKSWVDRIYNIKNKFHRDSSSIESFVERYGEEVGAFFWKEKTDKTAPRLETYIKKYGEKNGNELWNKWREDRRSVGLEIMTKKYGKEEGKRRWEKYLKKWKEGIKKRKERGNWKNGLTLEEFIEKHGNEKGKELYLKRAENISKHNSLDGFIERFGKADGENKWKEYCKNMDHTSLKFFIKRYGKEGDKKYKEYCKNMSYSGSLQGYIDRYGEEEGKKRKTEAVTKSFANQKKNFGYSKISQKLFWEVYEKSKHDIRDKYQFEELNKEHMFFIFSGDVNTIKVDFKYENKIIEFNGDYWHSLENVKKRDEIKNVILTERDYKILYIKESDYKKNKDLIIDECLKFLNNE